MVSSHTFEKSPYPVPLSCNTIYYVESLDNEPLNQIMRLIAQSVQPLFVDRELPPFSFKLKYLTREELAADTLRARIVGDYVPELVTDVIDDLRECLNAEEGGTLTARCLPKFDNDVCKDDYTICTDEDFKRTRPEKALKSAWSFAREVAMQNFYRISGVTYFRFKEPNYVSSRRSSGSFMEMMIAPLNKGKIIEELQKRLAEISESMEDNPDDIIRSLEKELEKLKNQGKINAPCKLKCNWDKLYLIHPDGEEQEVVFGRHNVAKTLYIFFLRRIELAAKNHSDPIYVSKVGLADYKNELLDIYRQISVRDVGERDIESWWDPQRNDFDTALSSIRNYFKRYLDVELIKDNYKKCYSIETMGGKDRYNSDVYGIALDPKDFDLGFLSSNNQNRI